MACFRHVGLAAPSPFGLGGVSTEDANIRKYLSSPHKTTLSTTPLSHPADGDLAVRTCWPTLSHSFPTVTARSMSLVLATRPSPQNSTIRPNCYSDVYINHPPTRGGKLVNRILSLRVTLFLSLSCVLVCVRFVPSDPVPALRPPLLHTHTLSLHLWSIRSHS